MALVGESGSGKTTLARAIMGIVPHWTGQITYAGKALSEKLNYRGRDVRREIQYIFQSPYNALNPRRTIGDSVALPVREFFGLKGRKARERVDAALERCALPAEFAARYPAELSGGERQRAAIARAIVCEPRILVCDEITSALDVSVQASIIGLLEELRTQDDLSVLFITHNLALVRTIADRVVVMENGRVVEAGETGDVLDAPSEAYTEGLLKNTPALRAWVGVDTKQAYLATRNRS